MRIARPDHMIRVCALGLSGLVATFLADDRSIHCAVGRCFISALCARLCLAAMLVQLKATSPADG